MNILDRYKIDLRQLPSDGLTYRYELSDSFFEAIEATLVKSGNVIVDLKVNETAGTFMFDFKIEGVVQVPCDRCLENVNVTIRTENELKVKLGDSFVDDGDMVVVEEDDAELNVAWYIYEFIALQIPLVHVHEDGQCNEEMINALKQHLVNVSQNVDGEAETTEKVEGVTDPRWNELKKILDNN